MSELIEIMIKFKESKWDLISKPASTWLIDKKVTNELIKSIKQADEECGNCGCDMDPLYKRAIVILESINY